MAGELLTAYIKLTPTMQGLQGAAAKALRPASAEGDKAGRRAGQAFGTGFSKNMKRAVGVAAGFIAFKSLKGLLSSTTTEFLDLAGATRGLQRITGGTVEEVSGLRGAMQLAGVDVTKIATSMTIFSKNLGKAAGDSKKQAVYNKLLGDSWRNADGSVKPLTELLPVLSDQFAKLPDGAEKTALATQLFGRAGAGMLPFLGKGSAGIAELTDKAKDLGITLDDGSIEKMGEYREASRTWAATLQGLKITIGSALLPVLTSWATTLTDKVGPAIRGIRDFVTNNSGYVKDFAGEIGTAFDGLKTTIDNVRDALGVLDGGQIDGAALGAALADAVRTGLEKLADIGGDLFAALGKMFEGVDWVGLGIEMGRQVPSLLIGLAAGILNFDLTGLLAGVGDHWFQILMGVLTIAFAPAKLIGGVAKLLTKIPFVGKFLAWIVTGISKLGAPLRRVASEAFQFFGLAFREALNLGGPGIIGRLVSVLRGAFPRIAEWARGLAARLGKAITDAFVWMGNKAGSAFGAVIRFIRSIPGRILRGLGSLGRLLAPAGRNVISGLGSAISSRIGSVVSGVRKIPGRIKSAITNPKGLLRSIGSNIIDGLISGISKSTEAVRRAVGNVGGAIKKKIKSMFGINSPSRWMRDQVGKQLVAGMTIGVLSAAPAFRAQLEDLAVAPKISAAQVGTASRSVAAGVRADADAVSTNAGGRSGDRPIYTDGGTLLGWIREIANGEAVLVWNEQADLAAVVGRQKP